MVPSLPWHSYRLYRTLVALFVLPALFQIDEDHCNYRKLIQVAMCYSHHLIIDSSAATVGADEHSLRTVLKTRLMSQVPVSSAAARRHSQPMPAWEVCVNCGTDTTAASGWCRTCQPVGLAEAKKAREEAGRVASSSTRQRPEVVDDLEGQIYEAQQDMPWLRPLLLGIVGLIRALLRW